MLIDSHCHLNYPDFEEEGVKAVLERAKMAGIDQALTINVKVSEYDQLIKLTDEHPMLDCTVGTHPHHANEDDEMTVTTEKLIELAQHPRVVAIGETGLDYFYETAPKAEQKDSLKRHIAACLELDMPIIIHSRDADEDMAWILADEGQGKLRGVMHCFSSGPMLAQAALNLGFYISISGIVTFKKSEELQEIVRDIVPLDRILVETDAPYLAPIPHRGKRNEPAFVTHTAEKVAELKEVSPEYLAHTTTENFFTLFNKAKRRDVS